MSELKWLEWNFRELIENSGEVFIVLDDQFKIRYISSSVEKVYGLEPIALVGRDIFEFVAPTMVEEYRNELRNSVTGRSYEIALEFRKGVKSYFDAGVTSAQREDGTMGFVVKLHDITANRAKERELIKANQQLDQVIFKTTHDLKAPLMSALGLINLAEKAPIDQRDEYLMLIKRSLLKLSGFIEEMNGFYRNEKMALQREKIELGNLIKDEVDTLQNLYQAGKIKIEIAVSETAEFFSDVVRVKTIVTNLLTNAIKYADPDKLDPFVKVDVKVTTEKCVMTFTDNGIGIEDQFKNKIFDLFYRATSQSQGTGIGLFIVKDTIERLSGKIEVESEVGKGTLFKVQIPNQLYKAAELN